VGSFIGDVGLRYANFFRTIGYDGQVYCFDPTLSGDLIPYNIRLNGLEKHVHYCPLAISNVNGYLTFFQREGHSDSSASASNASTHVNAIVESVRLSDFIRKHGIKDAFIKLDTENLERVIIADIRDHLNSTSSAFGFEFHVHQRDMWPLIPDLLRTHVLFDIGYLPNPFCFSEISADGVEAFLFECANRPYQYTDILAISRATPALNDLLKHLRSFTPRPVVYSLVYPT
jgi:FkbM family methyltransferase